MPITLKKGAIVNERNIASYLEVSKEVNNDPIKKKEALRILAENLEEHKQRIIEHDKEYLKSNN